MKQMATRPTKKAVRLYGARPAAKTESYQRVRSADVYHSSRWTKASRIYRAEHPLCAACMEKGFIRASEVVDHVVPYPVCTDFFDQNNWQALCKKCNAEKGNKDKRLIQEYKKKQQEK